MILYLALNPTIMQFTLTQNSILQTEGRELTVQKKEMLFQVVPVKLKDKKVQVLQELVILKILCSEVVVEYLGHVRKAILSN